MNELSYIPKFLIKVTQALFRANEDSWKYFALPHLQFCTIAHSIYASYAAFGGDNNSWQTYCMIVVFDFIYFRQLEFLIIQKCINMLRNLVNWYKQHLGACLLTYLLTYSRRLQWNRIFTGVYAICILIMSDAVHVLYFAPFAPLRRILHRIRRSLKRTTSTCACALTRRAERVSRDRCDIRRNRATAAANRILAATTHVAAYRPFTPRSVDLTGARPYHSFSVETPWYPALVHRRNVNPLTPTVALWVQL